MIRALGVAALPVLFVAVPVAAQQQPPMDESTERALATIENPQTADAIAAIAESLTRSIMAMPVGEIAQHVRRIDPDSDMADLPDDATLGDLAGARDGDAVRIGDDAHAATRLAGSMSRQFVAMVPVLQAMARDLAAQWELARRDSRRR